MVTRDEVGILLAEIEQWRHEGAIDALTYQRLVARYRAPVADPAEPAEGAGVPELDSELEAEATKHLSLERGSDLESELEAEAAEHLSLERRARQEVEVTEGARRAELAVPAAARPTDLAAAAASTLRDLTALSVEAGAGPPPPNVAAELLERESRWPSRLRPFLYENALWLAGGLLVLVGSIYFLRLVWDDLSSLLHHLAIASALQLYAGLFFGAGYLLARRRQAHAVGRILFAFGVALLPLGSVAVGELAAALLVRGPGGALLALLAVALSLALQALLLLVIGGLYERSCARVLAGSGLALALLTGAVAPLASLGRPISPLLVGAAGLMVLGRALGALVRGRVYLRASLLLCGGAALLGWLVLVVRAHVASPTSPTRYASLLAGLGGLLVLADARLRARSGEPARLSVLGLVFHGLVLLAVVLSVQGLVVLGYFDLGARLGVLGSALVATLVFGRAALLHGRSAFTHLAASTGLLAYFFLPAPFAGLLLLVQQRVSAALGYASEPLPVAYYGLTFVPYLIGVTILATRCRAARPDLSRDLQHFLTAVSVLLVGLAAAAPADLRPMLWTWPIYGLGAYLGAAVFGRPGLLDAGHAVLLAFLWVLGLRIASPAAPALGPAVLLGGAALAFGLAAVCSRAAHLARASLAALLLSVVALLFWPALSSSFLVFALAAPALAALTALWRSRLTAHLVGVAALAALLQALLLWSDGQARPFSVALLALGAFASGLARAMRVRADGDGGYLIVGQPATLTAALSLPLALAVSLPLADRVLAVLAAALLAHLALIARGCTTMVLAAVAGAVTTGWFMEPLLGRGWPLALDLLAGGYLLLGSSLPESWPRARRRGGALHLVAYLTAAVALVAAASFLDEGRGLRSFGGIALCAGLSLFALAAAVAYRRRPHGPTALAVLAGGAAGFLLLLVDRLVGPTQSSAWIYAATCAALALAWGLVAPRLTVPALARRGRAIAAVLVLLPLGLAVAFLLLAMLQCGPHSGWLLDLLSLRPSLVAVLGAAVVLCAARRAEWPGAPWVRRELMVGAGLGLAVLGMRLTAPAAHLHAALGLVTVGLGLLCGRGSVSLGWVVGTGGLALLGSHGHLDQPGPALAMACLTLALALAGRRAPRQASGALAYAWPIGLLAAGQLAAVWLAALLSRGGDPPAALLAVLAAAALLGGLLLNLLSARGRAVAPARISRAALLAAPGLAMAGFAGCWPAAPAPLICLVAGTLAAAAALQLAFGLRDRRTSAVVAALAALSGLYLVLRWGTGLQQAGPWLDVLVLLVGSQVALWLGLEAGRELWRPLLGAALLWPFASAAPLLALETGPAALASLLVALHYGILAGRTGIRHLTLPALLFGNLSLLLSFAAAGWSDLLLWAMPVGISLLWLVHVYRGELGRAGGHALRSLILVALYTLGVAEALTAVTPVQALVVVPVLCVASIVAGTLLRVRAYVLFGIGFLFADLLLNMLRYGLASRPLGALFLTLLGLAVVSAMVVFSLERDRILRRYSWFLGQLRTWE